MINACPGECAQPIVGVTIELDHLEVLLDQLDGGYELRTLEAMLVELIGVLIGGRDQRDAAGEQPFEQTAHQHGVTDIGDVKLVEAQEPYVARDASGDDAQRIFLTLQLAQAMMNRLHEAMEMNALLARDGRHAKELVHQKALAAPDRAPKVDAAYRSSSHQALQPCRRRVREILVQTLQGVQSTLLCAVKCKPVLCGDRAQGRGQVGGARLGGTVHQEVQKSMDRERSRPG